MSAPLPPLEPSLPQKLNRQLLSPEGPSSKSKAPMLPQQSLLKSQLRALRTEQTAPIAALPRATPLLSQFALNKTAGDGACGFLCLAAALAFQNKEAWDKVKLEFDIRARTLRSEVFTWFGRRRAEVEPLWDKGPRATETTEGGSMPQNFDEWRQAILRKSKLIDALCLYSAARRLKWSLWALRRRCNSRALLRSLLLEALLVQLCALRCVANTIPCCVSRTLLTCLKPGRPSRRAWASCSSCSLTCAAAASCGCLARVVPLATLPLHAATRRPAPGIRMPSVPSLVALPMNRCHLSMLLTYIMLLSKTQDELDRLVRAQYLQPLNAWRTRVHASGPGLKRWIHSSAQQAPACLILDEERARMRSTALGLAGRVPASPQP